MKYFCIKISVVTILLTLQTLSQSTANYDWSNKVMGYGRDGGVSNIITRIDTKGNLIGAGSHYGTVDWQIIFKISPLGSTIWQMNSLSRDQHVDGKILDLIVDEMDNIYVAGYYGSFFVESNIDTLFVKKIISADSTPKVVWEYTHPVGGNGRYFPNWKYYLDINDSSIVLAGLFINRDPLADIVTIKLDTNGTELWEKYYNNGVISDLAPQDIEFDIEGNIFVYGNSVKGDSTTAKLIKYSPTGDSLWERSIINPENSKTYAVDMQLDGLSPWISANSSSFGFLFQYDAQGNIINEIQKIYDLNLGLSIDEYMNIYQVNKKSIAKYSSSGSFIASTALPSLSNVYYYYFDVDEEQNIYVLGMRIRSNFYTVKVNRYLEIESAFETIYNDPPGEHYESRIPFDITASTPFGVYITGDIAIWDSSNYNSSYNLLTVKYSELPTEIKEQKIKPNSYILSQNYPNPFNPSTTISYSIPEQGYVQLKVFDVLGREVKTLVNKEQVAGSYEVVFNLSVGGNELSSGVYFYTLSVGSFVETQKMLLLR